jgi:hypothetical protein
MPTRVQGVPSVSNLLLSRLNRLVKLGELMDISERDAVVKLRTQGVRYEIMSCIVVRFAPAATRESRLQSPSRRFCTPARTGEAGPTGMRDVGAQSAEP